MAIDDSRTLRMAKGSGTSIIEVKTLLEEHKKLKVMIEKVGKTNLGKGKDDKLMMRNPGQLMGKLQQMVDPKTLASLGGAGNIMEMMKQMSNDPSMSEMMKQMQGGGKPKRR